MKPFITDSNKTLWIASIPVKGKNLKEKVLKYLKEHNLDDKGKIVEVSPFPCGMVAIKGETNDETLKIFTELNETVRLIELNRPATVGDIL